MILEIILLLLSLAVLAKASIVTIDKAIRLSKITGISNAAVGFVFIAIATSLPELTISIISSLKGEGLLSFGNVIGANITNLTLIFGLVALSGAKLTKDEIMDTDKAVIFTSIIALFLIFLGYSDFSFGIFALIIFYVFFQAIIHKGIDIQNHNGGLKTIESIKAIFWLLISVFIVVVSANFVTEFSIKLASNLKITEAILGATIISLGTTLPELSIAIAAIKKKNVELAVGDTVGSIVANLTLVLGTTSIIGSISISGLEHLLIIFVISNLLFLYIVQKINLGIKEGIILILFYLVFILLSLFV